MATSVQIELMVDEKGAVSGVRAFDTSVKGSVASTNALDATLQKLNAHLDQLGQHSKKNIPQIGKDAMSSREQLRLLTEETGIHIPRALQKVALACPQVVTALKGVGAVMMGLGAIQIGAMVFEGLYRGAEKVYEKFFDVEGALRRFNKEAGEAAGKRFDEDSGLDQLNSDLLRVNQQLDQFNQKKAIATNKDANWKQTYDMFNSSMNSIFTLGMMPYKYHYGVSDANGQNEAQGEQDSKALRLIKDTHERNLQLIEDNRLIGEAKLTGIAKARAAQNADNAKAAEDHQFALKQAYALAEIANRGIDPKLKPGDKDYRERKVVSPNAGNAEEEDARAHATAEFKAKQIEIGREQSQELARMREEALETTLRGTALWEAKEKAALEDLKYKDMDSTAARAAVHAKFHAEELKWLAEEDRQTNKIARQSLLAGMTGIAKTQQEGANKIAEINSDPNVDPMNRPILIEAANREMNAQITAEQRSFSQEIDSLADASAAHQVQGFARIRADATKELDALQKKFDETYGHMDPNNPATPGILAAGNAQLQKGRGSIITGEHVSESELARRNADETAKIETEARMKFYSAEKQKTAAIQAELAERKKMYLEELQAQQISDEDYNRRVIAAEQEANAQMIEASREAREKMAHQFTDFFKGMEHPGRYFAEQGQKVAGEAAAALVQRFQGAGANGQEGEQSGFSGILGKISGKAKGADAKAEHRGGGTHEQAGAFSILSATIHINSATIAGAGAGAGSGSAGGSDSGWSGSSGSTGLLASGSTGASGGVGGGSTDAGGVIGSANRVGGGITQGVGTAKQMAGVFGIGGASGGSGATRGSGTGIAALDNQVIGSGLGVWGAHESTGGIGGAAQGALSGAKLGMEVAGPMGAAIGAIGGAVIGYLGTAGPAHDYDKKTVQPRLANDRLSYEHGEMDYSSAYADMQSLQSEAFKATSAMGAAGRRYRNDHILPEIKQAEASLSAQERAGRSNYPASAASYAVGTNYVPRTALYTLHQGETVMTADENQRIRQTHAAYKATMQSSSARGGFGGGDRNLNMSVHAIDAKGVAQFFDQYKHHMRSALNDSYAENSGGGMS